jgi:NTE family protein
VFTADGTTLVDGALLDNVPVGPMHALKAGPNVVIHFELPTLPRCPIDHRTLPSRWRLMMQSLTRAGRARLPPAPTPHAVLLHGLTLPRSALDKVLGPDDALFSMRPPEGLTHLDWHEQERIRQAGGAYARRRIAELRAQGHRALRVAST